MFVIINPITKTVRLGIIDYVQQYTIDKTLESYLKQTISSEEPTIISPDLYKQRFRTAMDKYFIAMIPDKDRNLNNLIRQKFNADKIKWFTK
jgi:1-phosphatidylinositol-3-phosphate 5-kinase